MATNEKKDTTVRFTDLPNELTSQGRNVWLAGLGALATVGDEGTRLFNSLVERGTEVEKEGSSQIEETTSELNKRQQEAMNTARNRSAEAGSTVSKALADALERFGVPTRQEVTRLSNKVDTLAHKVDMLTAALDQEAVEAAKSSREASVYFVAPHEEGGWALKMEGTDQVTSVHETKEEARKKGRQLAKDHKPSRLLIHKQDGSVQETLTYDLDD